MNTLFDENGIWKLDDYIMLDAENINYAIEYVLSKFPKADKIGIASDVNGVYEVELGFLKKLPNITHFRLSCMLAKSVDIQPLYHLKQLQWLQWWSNDKVDISEFPKLSTFICHYSDDIKFDSSSLEFLHIAYAYQLSFVNKMSSLTKLELRSYSGENLSGIDCLENLNKLTIKQAKKLTSIKDVARCKNLQYLELESINKEIDLSILSKCENLKGLYLHTSIQNCLFVEGMKNIESFVCKEILDNNLSPIFESTTLSYVYLYKYKRTYNYSKEEFEKKFQSNNSA